MSQLTLDAALEQVALNNDWLAWARRYAQDLSGLQRWVTTDDIRAYADRLGYQPDSPHAFGAIFKCPGWVMVGRQASTYASNNKRWINRYRWEPSDLPAPRSAP